MLSDFHYVASGAVGGKLWIMNERGTLRVTKGGHDVTFRARDPDAPELKDLTNKGESNAEPGVQDPVVHWQGSITAMVSRR
jgi:hypothetical protein